MANRWKAGDTVRVKYTEEIFPGKRCKILETKEFYSEEHNAFLTDYLLEYKGKQHNFTVKQLDQRFKTN